MKFPIPMKFPIEVSCFLTPMRDFFTRFFYVSKKVDTYIFKNDLSWREHAIVIERICEVM